MSHLNEHGLSEPSATILSIDGNSLDERCQNANTENTWSELDSYRLRNVNVCEAPKILYDRNSLFLPKLSIGSFPDTIMQLSNRVHLSLKRD